MSLNLRVAARGLAWVAGGFLLGAPGCAKGLAQRDLLKVLDDQVVAWNAGDIDGFMKGYWRSGELTFVSVSPPAVVPAGAMRPAAQEEVSKGWQATRDRYKRRYPTAERMGRLSFEDLAVTRFEENRAEVQGRYRVERTGETLTGRFTLDMRKIDERWVIIRDRTIADGPPQATTQGNAGGG